MNKCKRCNVWVADDTMVCPLCHTILTENKSMEQSLDHNANKMQGVQRPGYPDVKKNTRRFRKAGRILLFISLAVEMLLAFINYLTFDAAPKYWSVVTGGIIAYLILTLWDIFSRRQGHIRKIYTAHIDEVEEILWKSRIYNDSYREQLRQSFSNLFAHESDKFLRLYYGFFIKESDILKRPLSKMKQDIAKQIGLI